MRDDEVMTTPTSGTVRLAEAADARAVTDLVQQAYRHYTARIGRQPVLRAVRRTGVLHDMFKRDALLVGHGGQAELEPLGTVVAGRDDAESHWRRVCLRAAKVAFTGGRK